MHLNLGHLFFPKMIGGGFKNASSNPIKVDETVTLRGRQGRGGSWGQGPARNGELCEAANSGHGPRRNSEHTETSTNKTPLLAQEQLSTCWVLHGHFLEVG